MPDLPPMVAELQGNIEPFKRAMRDAASEARTGTASISAELSKLGDAFGGLTNIRDAAVGLDGLLGFARRFGPFGAAVAIAVKGTSDLLDNLVEIGKGAEAAGISTDAYQELAQAASLAGVSQKDFSKALKEFEEQSAHAVNDFGKIKDALKDYDPEALKAIRSTSDLGQQLRIYADVVKEAGTEAQRTTLTTAAFGKSSEELVRFLSGGSDSIDQTTQRMRELGLVIDEDLIRRAPQIREEFTLLANVISTELQNSVVTLAPYLVELAKVLGDVAAAIASVIQGSNQLDIAWSRLVGDARAFADRPTALLKGNLEDINTEIDKLQQKIGQGQGFFDTLVNGLDNALSGEGGTVEQGLTARRDALIKQRDEIQGILGGREFAAHLEPTERPSAGDAAPVDRGFASKQKAAVTELQRIEKDYLTATRQTTAAIQAEYQVRLTALQKSLADGLISYGDYVKAQAELEATATAKINEEALKRIKPLTDAISTDLSRAFDTFVRTGKLNFKELTRDMLADIAKVAFQMNVLQPLFGGGPAGGGGIIGNLLAGALHDGGMAGGGPRRSLPALTFAGAPRFHDGGLVGLRPDEVPAVLQTGERVLSRSETAAMGSGGGNGTVVQVINQSGGEVSQQRSRSGNTDYVRIMIGAVKDSMGRGDFDGVMRGRFNTAPATGRR